MTRPTPDMIALAKAVLSEDDVTGAMALSDCLQENIRGGERVNPEYVNGLEDLLRLTGLIFRHAGQVQKTMAELGKDEGWMLVDPAGYKTWHSNYFKLERWAKSLNRGGLS
jgi:hypothetical protein